MSYYDILKIVKKEMGYLTKLQEKQLGRASAVSLEQVKAVASRRSKERALEKPLKEPLKEPLKNEVKKRVTLSLAEQRKMDQKHEGQTAKSKSKSKLKAVFRKVEQKELTPMFMPPVERTYYRLPASIWITSQADLDRVSERLRLKPGNLKRGTLVVTKRQRDGVHRDDGAFLWDGHTLRPPVTYEDIEDFGAQYGVTQTPVMTGEPINLCSGVYSPVWLPSPEQRMAVKNAPEVSLRNDIKYREVQSGNHRFRFYYERKSNEGPPDFKNALYYYHNCGWENHDGTYEAKRVAEPGFYNKIADYVGEDVVICSIGMTPTEPAVPMFEELP